MKDVKTPAFLMDNKSRTESNMETVEKKTVQSRKMRSQG